LKNVVLKAEKVRKIKPNTIVIFFLSAHTLGHLKGPTKHETLCNPTCIGGLGSGKKYNKIYFKNFWA